MKALICPDSYKGSADAKSVANAVGEGFLSVLPDAYCMIFPIADGGEGSVGCISDAVGASVVYTEVLGPYGEHVRASYAVKGLDAYIEMAEASGLCLTDRREPLKASTYGTGQLICDAATRGAKNITVFIGGSATCDGGMGMAAALGYKFYDKRGELLFPCGESMERIERIEAPKVNMLDSVIVRCACDVTNPPYGKNGAAYVFAPQKGAGEDDVIALDRGLRNLCTVIEKDLSVNVHSLAGGGAAGGLGAGLFAFASAEMRGGFSLISDILSLDSHIEDADIVITGEGCTDRQSMMGKVVSQISEMCKKHEKPCYIISGAIKDTELLLKLGISGAFASSYYASDVSESIKNPLVYIKEAAKELALSL